MNGKIYLIPNSLGTDSLESVLSYDVLKIVSSLSFFVGEKAKNVRFFLKNVNQTFPLRKEIQKIIINELNINTPEILVQKFLDPILQGNNLGLISDAGMPAIADPGSNFIRLAHKKNIKVIPLVGPSSIFLALSASGLNGQNFSFNGYLPSNLKERVKKIKQIENRSKKENQTQIFIETPYRNENTLLSLFNHCDENTLICIATNLTLPIEFVKTKSNKEWKKFTEKFGMLQIKKKPTIFLILSR